MAEEKKIPPLTTPALAVLLAVAAFLAGTFWMRLRFLQGEKSNVEDEEAVQTSPIPEEKMVLGAEEIDRITAGGMVKGDEDAPVTIVEFSEYQCPFCKRYVDETYPEIWEEYEGKIRYIFRDYPLPFHQHAQIMAEVARCAGDQGKYWEMHDLLFEKSEEWIEKEDVNSLVTTYARSLGLDVDEFSNCLDSGKQTQAVKDDLELGQSVGVTGTPTFFINGQKLVGAQLFEAFKAIIDQELD